MSKVEHYDKIWSHAANQNYRDNWERTFGDKKPKRKKPDKRRYHAGVVCIPEPGNFVRADGSP